jgi:mannose-1-phosphate guanylyltransferase/phosphomannomutase
MKAIIIAGGEGKRLRPLTETIPKPMIKVAGIPILEYTIKLLKKHSITDITLALCYLPQPIIDHFGNGDNFGVSIHYTFENQNSPLGTAGALLPARDFITETCIVTYADVLRDLDIAKMIQQHKETMSVATINIYKHTGGNFKSSILFDKNNNLTEFKEHKTSSELKESFAWSNGSFYIIEPEILNYIHNNNPTDFACDIFPKLILATKKVTVFPSEGYFIDIGTLETLTRSENDIAQGIFIP